MSSSAGQAHQDTSRDAHARATAIADLILVRIASEGGATRNMITRDLSPLCANKLSPAEWRQTANAALSRLDQAGLVAEKRARLKATQNGAARAARFLGVRSDQPEPWQVQRDVALVAKALGVQKLTAAKRKALATPDGLRGVILQTKFGLSAKACKTAASTRAALAVVALERAFGKKIKSSLGTKSSLPAKASRLLAGQLLDPPRELASDTQLVSHIAAEQVGARQTSVEELRHALLSRFAISLLAPRPSDGPAPPKPTLKSKPAKRPVTDVMRTAANDTTPVTTGQQSRPGCPDLPQFSRVVNAAAASCAEGWPGNMKAFISRVWRTIRDGYPEWEISEETFKSKLVDAHRAGAVHLSGADLKSKTDMEAFEQSQITYKNTVWHFVRVEA